MTTLVGLYTRFSSKFAEKPVQERFALLGYRCGATAAFSAPLICCTLFFLEVNRAERYASLGSIQFSGYLRIPPFSPFFHPDTWIPGFLLTALWGSRLP